MTRLAVVDVAELEAAVERAVAAALARPVAPPSDWLTTAEAAKLLGVRRGNGQRLYVWLKANGWPRDRYQLLCCNCNQGKARNGGVCPHATRRSA